MRTQIAVVGAGPAGACLAQRLASCGIDTALIAGSCGVHRWEHLAPSARPELEDLGLNIDEIQASHVGSGVEIAWSGRPFFRSYLTYSDGPGLSIERTAFDCLLRQRATQAGADVLTASLVNVEERARHYVVTAAPVNGDRGRIEVSCDWLVDATGRAAVLARRLGSTRIKRHARVAVIAELEAVEPSRALVVESAPSGWWYTVPRGGDHQVTVAWVTSPAAVRGGRVGERFRDALATTALVRQKAKPRIPTHWICRPAGSGRLDHVVGRRWLAIGDAAGYTDPLWGQGVTHALQLAARASELLALPARERHELLAIYDRAVTDNWLEGEQTRDDLYRQGWNSFRTEAWKPWSKPLWETPVTALT